jgi:hypothetical protein
VGQIPRAFADLPAAKFQYPLVSFALRVDAMELMFVACGFLLYSIAFPPKKEPKSAAQQFGEAFEKLLKDILSASAKKDS